MTLVTRKLNRGTTIKVDGIPMRLSKDTNVRTTKRNWILMRSGLQKTYSQPLTTR